MPTWKDVEKIGCQLPAVEVGTSYGTPSLRVGKVFMTRYRTEDDSIVIKMPMDERDMRIEAAPDIYFLTDHYRPWPTVLVKLKTVSKAELTALLQHAWRNAAPKKVLKMAEAAEAQKPAAKPKRKKTA